MLNLAAALEQESAVLVNSAQDAKEKEEWLKKVDEDVEKEVLCLNLDQLTISPLSVPDVPKNLVVSKLESMCLDMSNLLIDKGKNLQSLSKDLS